MDEISLQDNSTFVQKVNTTFTTEDTFSVMSPNISKNEEKAIEHVFIQLFQ